MNDIEKIEFDKFSFSIDPENLRFDESTLSKYIQNEGGYYDSFGHYLSLAERNLQNNENLHEKTFCEKFVEAKELGASDKLAEAKAKSNPNVVLLKEEIVKAKYVVNRLKNHIKAWDKNHDNAQSMGHMLRKQMDKLGTDVIGNFNWKDNYNYTIQEVKSTEEKQSGFDDNLGIEGLV
jgi:hypothetical protein